MNIRELKKQVYKRANQDFPIRHRINFSLAKWKFDELYIDVDICVVIKEVVENKAWIVYELDERGGLREISLYKDYSEAEYSFLCLLKKTGVIH